MAFELKKKHLTPAEALPRVKQYCSVQERSQKEVRTKLSELGVHGNDLENIITGLISEGFLNEERFAIAFAGGKFRMKGWGIKKIEHALKAHGVSENCIQQAVKSIDESDYNSELKKSMRKYLALIKSSNLIEKKQKLGRHFIGKGYGSGLVWKMAQELVEGGSEK